MNATQSSKLKAKSLNNGQLSIQILIFGAVAVIFVAGFLIWLDTVSESIVRSYDKTQAFDIAEAGIEYYRWHLAHAPNDFQDGTSSTGPYTHNYFNTDGKLVGQFILNITPPPVGSSVVIIKSTGKVVSDPTIEKIIQVKMGITSFAQYAAILNGDVRFGAGSEVWGEIFSNGGIHFDGLAHNLVESALTTYSDPDHSNPSGQQEYAVHTHVIPPPGTGVDDSFQPLEAPPNPLASRPDVFMAGRKIGVPAADFTGITLNLVSIKNLAQSNGFYLGSSTSGLGYDVVLHTNNTFDLYTVTAIAPPPNGCTNVSNQPGWGSWSIGSETLLGTYPTPTSGMIFLGDDVWVRGQINNSRLTIASARFPDNPATRSSITVNDNLTYTNYDGRDVIGLIAQQDINVGLYSDDILTIDGALMAQDGRVGRYYYRPPSSTGGTNSRCAPWHIRQEITVYGMIGSNQRYGFAYADFGGPSTTGYLIRNFIYDSNLLYGPPPSFPLASQTYQTLSWDELK